MLATSQRMKSFVLAAAILTIGFGACSKAEPPPAPAPTPTTPAPAVAPAPVVAALAPADEAKALFATGGLCFSCHGSSGAGDGPAAVALNPKPRAYTDATWQASVTDDVIAQTIKLGGKAMGKSEMMPPSPQLSEATVAELVKLIRGFKK